MKKLWWDWRERAIIALLFAACLVLAFLQYRWAGELSRAEAQRLFASAAGRLEQLTRAFDTELGRSVMDFIPSGEEVERLGPVRANEERFRAASQRLDRPVFRKIAAAVPDKERKLQFLEANVAEQRFLPGEWPEAEEWQDLRDRLQGVAHGESPRGTIVSPASALMEVPVFGPDQELEWMIFELDTAYATATWLPELVQIYLNPEGEESFEVEVVWRTNPSRSVDGTTPVKANFKPDAEASLFPIRFLRGRKPDGRWLIGVTHREGSIDAAVLSARTRNLGVAFLLLALIATAGATLLRYTQQARRLALAQYQFFAGISHELRTPLTVIQGAGHNLLSGVVKDEAQRETYVRAIVKQSAQLNEMVDQVLSYSAAPRAPRPADAGSTLLNVAVSEAIESAAIELEQSGRSVDVDMPPDLPPVRGDQSSLRRVLGNLILNAVRHGGGPVRVMATRSGPMVQVQVADSGDGIPAEELQHVFEPFFRGERARTGRTRGTGLGLSLVKETVESIGGGVAVESKVGKGTIFTVRLPVAV